MKIPNQTVTVMARVAPGTTCPSTRDRSAILRMAGNIASGLLANGDVDLNSVYRNPSSVARVAVAVARAIITEVDGDEDKS